MHTHTVSEVIHKLETKVRSGYDKATKGNYRQGASTAKQAVRTKLASLFRVLVLWYYDGYELPQAAEPKCERSILCTCNRSSCIGRDPSMRVWTNGMKRILNDAK